MALDAESIIRMLDLKPLPQEGGFYRETHRAAAAIPAASLPEMYTDARNASTAIYYLITCDVWSALHRLSSDEVFHFYLGDPVEMLLLGADGRAELAVLGTDLATGMRPQLVVPGHWWQGARLVEGGRFALLGTTVAPGFDFADFHEATRDQVEKLAEAHPDFADRIRALAPPNVDH